MKTAPILIVLVILLISGCAQADSPAPPNDSLPKSEESLPVSNSSLSARDQQILLEAIASEQTVAIDQLTIAEVKEADWPDACLGLAGPDEFCAQMITPGWAVRVSDGQQDWNYRTNLDLSAIKLDPS